MVKIKKAGSQLLMLRYIAEFTSLIKEGPLKSFKTGGKHDQIRVREMTLKVVIKKD